MAPKPTTIDAYLATVSGEKRAALDRLRKTVRAIVPNAEECISYGIPAFRLDGKIVGGFAATAKGCSYFPFSGSTLRTLADELQGYDMTKSALHFDPAHPLPVTLVRKLIQARRAEIRSHTGPVARAARAKLTRARTPGTPRVPSLAPPRRPRPPPRSRR